ncbi:SpoIIE family protein phosphatase [Streptomyces sp. NBC_01565]|uniref:SpoIIE family protein phosphatase n=1 Tax=Streptomyces sp. NBC_01565 TaxID=2975881 RepID=UPI002B1CCC20|nr:SpoIIE family protein phosphatase [Streptomyces sp. NBC_01565]
MAESEPTAPLDGPEAAMLDALFSQSPVGLHLLDTDLRVLRVNTATPAMRDVPVDDLLGRRFDEVYGLVDPDETMDLVRGVLDDGAPVVGHLVRAHHGDDFGKEYFHEVSVFRLQEPSGAVLGLAVAVVEVTAREEGRAREEVLRMTREQVGRTLDVVRTCQELVDVAVPLVADIAVVEVVDAVLRGDEPPLAPLPQDVPLRRAAFRGGDGPDEPQAHPLGDVRALPAPTPYTQALSDLRPRSVTLDDDLPWLVADPDRAAAIRAAGAHALVTAPLTVRDTVLGLISLYRTRRAEPYDGNDVNLVLQLADHTALCIDNARRYTREHTIAATVQRQLLPRRPASRPALETAYLLLPSDSGGQWYDTIPLPGTRTALAVGGVVGEGLHAVAVMGQLRTVVRSLSDFDLEPDELLARLNDTATFLAAERATLPTSDPLHRQALAAHFAYAVYDPLTLTCTVAGAGDPSLVVIDADGSAEVHEVPSGALLGSAEGTPFAATTFTVPAGSLLILSDSRLPALGPSGDREAFRRLAGQAGRSLEDLRDDILYAVAADAEPGPTALLIVRTHAFPADRVAVWELPDAPTAAAAARRLVRDQLEQWEVAQETAFDTELIVSELVTNAVRYGSPPLQLRVINDRVLTCEVRDTSASAPHLRHSSVADEGGRGLFIVAQLAQDWGTRYSAEGKTIWTEQSRPG